MELKFAPNLFLEVLELEKFRDSLDKNGWRKFLLQTATSFGLIKNESFDRGFDNGKVEWDLSNPSSRFCLKIPFVQGVNRFGEFLSHQQKNGITIPENGNWYWVKVKRLVRGWEEEFRVSIARDGLMKLVSGQGNFMKLLRGQPNFPTRIKLLDSRENTLEYDVLEVLDENQAILTHPYLIEPMFSAFVPENNLRLSIVGTFTPGIVVQESDKFPFQYDHTAFSIVEESSQNVEPNKIQGEEFYLARVRVTGGQMVIQDKRGDFFSSKPKEIWKNPVQMVGIETAKWGHFSTAASESVLEIGWGCRSENFTIDSSNYRLSLSQGSFGGKMKSLNDFTDGEWNEWKVYTSNGNWSKVLSSVKQGNSVNLILDKININDWSLDGGVTILNQLITVVPDAEEIEIFAKAVDLGGFNILNLNRNYLFPISNAFSNIYLTSYEEIESFYQINYRFKSGGEFSEWFGLSSDNRNGYLNENSWKGNGSLKPLQDRESQLYTFDSTKGYIKVLKAPYSITNFKAKVDKGDIIGVQIYTSIPNNLYEFKVGVSKKYIYFTNTFSIGSNVYMSLLKDGAVEGNEFSFHFDCQHIEMGGVNSIIFVQPNGTSTGGQFDVLKVWDESDMNEMKNKEGGVRIDFVYNGGNWVFSQNYKKENRGEIKAINGDLNNLFSQTGLGKIRGLYGWAICNGLNGTPDLSDRFIMGAGTKAVGTVGGNLSGNVNLTVENLPPHSHLIDLETNTESHSHKIFLRDSGSSVGSYRDANYGRGGDRQLSSPLEGDSTDSKSHKHTVKGDTGIKGSGTAFNIISGYHVLIYAQKIK